MDIVITYVDGNDPVWQKDYEKYTAVPAMTKRYRDWGTLRYLLRGIETRMPFIKNVFLVVSHESQVPAWADRDKLKIVLHKDIIPEEHLPTFNSTTIEMFLHRIQGLDERYIYFNDDMFPVGDCDENLFYRDGKAVMGFSRHILVSGQYKKHCRNSDRLARQAAGLKPSPIFVRPQHICSPMLKSRCEEAYEKTRPQIMASLSRLRTDDNLNQYLFLDYMLHRGDVIESRIPKKHFSLAAAGAESICKFLRKPTKALCCINDVHLSENLFCSTRDALLSAFGEIFPEKSRFEK